MTFYHLTDALFRGPSIIEAGVIRTTESNVGAPTKIWQPAGERVGPDVVWLLDALPTGAGHLRNGLSVEKQTYAFEVDVPAIRWLDWEWTARMHPEWRDALIQGGGGQADAEHWYVFPAPIRQARWVRHFAI